MIKKKGFGGFAVAVILAGSLAFGASAQDVSDAHMQAARGAISALGVTNQFDNILPTLSESLKVQLIQAYPNFQDQITETVNKTAISLAARRGDLEREAALVYAKAFSPEELNAIASFYGSDTGKKLLKDGPLVTRELLRAAEIWGAGIRRDLENQTNEAMLKIVGSLPPVEMPAAPGAPAPAAPAAPAAPKP